MDLFAFDEAGAEFVEALRQAEALKERYPYIRARTFAFYIQEHGLEEAERLARRVQRTGHDL